MIELISRPIVVICAFLGIFALLASGSMVIIQGSNDYSHNAQLIAAKQGLTNAYGIDTFSTQHFYGSIFEHSSNLTWGSHYYYNYLNEPVTDSTPITYSDVRPSVVYIYPIITTTIKPGPVAIHEVEFALYQPYGTFSENDAMVTQADIISHYNGTGQYTCYPVQLRMGYNFWIKNDTGFPLTQALQTRTHFNVSFSQSTTNFTSAVYSSDVLGMIGNILTFSVPGAPFVNELLACVLIPSYAIVIFFAARSFIPFLGG